MASSSGTLSNGLGLIFGSSEVKVALLSIKPARTMRSDAYILGLREIVPINQENN